MKCKICKQKIEQTFLNKIRGTYIKDEKGKKHAVCENCQREYPDKKKLLEAMKKS
jgi:hypothetical protein